MSGELLIQPLLECVPNRPSTFAAEFEVPLRGELSLLSVALDFVELPDEVDGLLGDGRGLDGLEEVAAHVGVTGGPTAGRDILDAVVTAVPIGEEDARGALQEPLRQVTRAA